MDISNIPLHVLKKRFRPEFLTWSAMRSRCYNRNSESWKNYGGRGISICRRWRRNFRQFLDDMGIKPSSKHTINRIDNSKSYSPKNCCWATPQENNENKRNNVMLEFQGETLCASAWGKKIGIHPRIILDRISSGWSIERVLTTPVGHSRKNSVWLTLNGKSQPLPHWARELGVDPSVLRERLKRMSVERALTMPLEVHKRRR